MFEFGNVNRPTPPFELFTQHPVALASRDHIVSGGSMMDDTKHRGFARKVIRLFTVKYNRPFAMLDLGCSSGGMVEEVIERGKTFYPDELTGLPPGAAYHPVTAVGLEGSDYSLARQRAAWARIPDHLFTCDITRPFVLSSTLVNQKCQSRQPHSGMIYGDGIQLGAPRAAHPFRFDLVTAWEVIEHIPEDALPVLVKNVLDHLMADGIWMLSVSTQPGYHHRTVRDSAWWLAKFDELGFARDTEIEAYISPDWPRGPEDPSSFNVALRRKIIHPETD